VVRSEFRAEVEVREAASELGLLAVLGIASMALVAGLAYAVLGGAESTLDTSASIARAGRLIAGAVAAGFVLLALVLVKPRPRRAVAVATPQGVVVGGRPIARRGLRSVVVVQDGDAFCVELERSLSTVRLVADSRQDAEALAGTILGRPREPAATARVRRRADYYNFLATAWMWLVTYGAICVLPVSLPLGALLTALAVPLTAWVTLRAVPAQVLVSDGGLTILHPLRSHRVSAGELAGAKVIDDDKVRIVFTSGDRLDVPELVDHPHDRAVTTSNPPAERLAAAVEAVVAARAAGAA